MEEQFEICIQIKSPTLIGSGEGFGALIDSDIVFDDMGIPYIPAKRVKGCLKDSAEEVKDILKTVNIPNPIDIDIIDVDAVFGKTGAVLDKTGTMGMVPGRVYFSNLFIPEYEANRTWLRYLMEKEKLRDYITREGVQKHFTEVRQLTRIGEDGIAFDHSLRSIRVVKRGEIFKGNVSIIGNSQSNDLLIQTLYLACLNFRHIGTSRNRGFGEISCTLDTGEREINLPEALCIR